MSVSDCIQIIENRFYTNSNLVLQYNKNTDINNEVENGANNSFFPTLKDKSNQVTELVSHESILQYQKSLDKCHNSQVYSNDHYINSNFDYKQRDNVNTIQSEHQNSFLNSPARMEHISNTRTANRLDNGESIATDQKGPVTKKCKVCSDKAVNQNFGVLSCESCKAFFRRNAIRSSPLKCSNGTDLCNVTSSTRKQCPSCRLKKCLSVGMRSELIQIRKKDGSQPKWMNRNSNGSNSSGRLSQDNNDETLPTKSQTSLHINVDLNSNCQSTVESTMMQSALWLDPNNFQSHLGNNSNFWVSMNNNSNTGAGCDGLKTNILSNNYMNSVNTPSMTNINSLSQRFDPIKYDLQIPMIKIKTSQNVIQPIALLPAIQGSLYTTSHVQPLYSHGDNTKLAEFSNDHLMSNEIVTELSMQTFYQTSNYTNDTNSKSFGSSHPSAFYPFNIQSNPGATRTIFYNGVNNADLKNTYLWDCCAMPTSESSINTDHNSFISMDSGSEPFYSNHTYPNSSSSSQKFYLSPDKYDGSDKNACLMVMDGHGDIGGSALSDIMTNTDLSKLFNSVTESTLASLDETSTNDHQFILQIGQIWEKTLGKLVIFPNPNNVNVDIDLKPIQYGSLDSVKNLSSNHNWDFDFINLSDIFLRQLKSFLSEVIQLINWENDLVETLKLELTDQLNNHLKTRLLVLMPVVFSNFITAQSDTVDDNLNLDKEVENYLFQETRSNIVSSETLENVCANFSVKKDSEHLNHASCHNVNCKIDLSLLSNRLLDLNSINYSSLQYLDKYCSGLCNFLSPSPVLFGLFSILKIIIMRTNINYCDPNWNESLLNRDASSLVIGDDKIAQLIYYLKRIFLTACDLVQTDTIEQRLQSLDQFLSWGKSQFDRQWMDFFNDTIRTQLTHDKERDDALLCSVARTNKMRDGDDYCSITTDTVFPDNILNEFGFNYCDVFPDI